MPALMRLTALAHPDIDEGKAKSIYVDPTRILVIERNVNRFTKEGSHERRRQAMTSLFEEVERVVAESKTLPMTMAADNEEQARANDRWMWARESAASLQTAYHLVSRASSEPEYYPKQDCTIVCLACGTGLEHGVMLSRVMVTETPEEIAAKLVGGNWS